MKTIKIILTTLVTIAFISCDDDIPGNDESKTLKGIWKLEAYKNIDGSDIVSPEADTLRHIILYFNDENDSGSISGHTVANTVFGGYTLPGNDAIDVYQFGGSKVREPDWGSRIWEAMPKADSYFNDSDVMKIFYDNKTKYMLFEPAKDLTSTLYWMQTKCADPWNTGESTPVNQTLDSINKYMSAHDISLYHIEIEFKDSDYQSCEACGCLTGNKITVTSKLEDKAKLEEIGFEEVQ
ncbi:MAG: META domain-containing protein [Bacteroidales bacterium]|nr:META domain-containing protein [Bacteroidales bacterium]